MKEEQIPDVIASIASQKIPDVIASDGDNAECMDSLKEIVGVNGPELACQIVISGVDAIKTVTSESDSLDVIQQSLQDLKPKDSIEARLAVQASVLFAQGLSNLSKSEAADRINQAEYYTNKGIKLLRLHNETIEALSKYRRGGEQKVTVTHAIVAGQVVNNFNAVGASTKNEGRSPCSEQNAEQKQEPMNTNHVGNQQCPMESAGFTGEDAQVQKQKKAKEA